MTSQWTAEGRFQRAIRRGHLLGAERATREMGNLSLASRPRYLSALMVQPKLSSKSPKHGSQIQ
jgi:hypothetical protein